MNVLIFRKIFKGEMLIWNILTTIFPIYSAENSLLSLGGQTVRQNE